MRRPDRLALVAAAFAALPACSGGGGGGGGGGPDYVETGRVEVTLLLPPAVPSAQDPFLDVTAFHVSILDSAGNVLVEADFGANDPLELQDLDEGNSRVIVLEGRDDLGTPISRGRTLPVTIAEGPTPATGGIL